MTNGLFFSLLVILTSASYFLSRNRAIRLALQAEEKLKSLPPMYGYLGMVHCFFPGFIVLILWLLLGDYVVDSLLFSNIDPALLPADTNQHTLLLNRIQVALQHGSTVEGDPRILAAAADYASLHAAGLWTTALLGLAASGVNLLRYLVTLKPRLPARQYFERFLFLNLLLSCVIAVLTTIGIVASLFYESVLFFREIPLADFLFGAQWSPQTALRSDQVAATGSFGILPLLGGTLLIAGIAILIAGPLGLMASIYMTQYASQTFRRFAKPILEILAGIPTVVYGFFAAVYVAPLFYEIGTSLGLSIAGESALATGAVMGVMIIPFVSSLSDDALIAVPKDLSDGSLALGATQSETVVRVILPSALPGIISAFLLAFSRAIGETMIVAMAAGLRPNLTINPLESVTTITVQIVALLTGDQEFTSAKTLAAFALGLVLFAITLTLNAFALKLVRRRFHLSL